MSCVNQNNTLLCSLTGCYCLWLSQGDSHVMDEHDLLEQQKRVRGWKTLSWNIFLRSCVVEKGEKTHFGVGTSCCPKWRILKYLVHKWGRVEWEWQMNQHSGSCMVCCENLNMKARPWLLLVCWHPHLGLNVVEEWHHRHFFCFCLVVCKISLLCYCKL